MLYRGARRRRRSTELVAAVAEDRIAGLKGFAAKTEENIARGAGAAGVVRRPGAGERGARPGRGAARASCERSGACAGPRSPGRCDGCAETIGDVDLLVASEDAGPIMERVRDAPVGRAGSSLAATTKTSILTRTGLQVDLRVIPREAWGAAMIYFTGSKAPQRPDPRDGGPQGPEAERVRAVHGRIGRPARGRDRGGGLRARWGCRSSRPRCGRTAARSRRRSRATLPDLLTEQQLRGDLHTHTDLTDGVASLEDDGRGRRRAAVRLLRGHRPRARTCSCSA